MVKRKGSTDEEGYETVGSASSEEESSSDDVGKTSPTKTDFDNCRTRISSMLNSNGSTLNLSMTSMA